MTLGGNQYKKDSKRLVWKEFDGKKQSKLSEINYDVDIENVILHPMEIRTFIIETEQNL